MSVKRRPPPPDVAECDQDPEEDPESGAVIQRRPPMPTSGTVAPEGDYGNVYEKKLRGRVSSTFFITLYLKLLEVHRILGPRSAG